MPRSTVSAVRTPGSDRPSSTSVIATAGRIPTTTVVGVEHARHRRDVGEHPADERVDDLERRDVDQHAARAGLDDPLGQVVLQRQRQPVVHVDLDRHEQQVPELEDRDPRSAVAHRLRRAAVAAARDLEARALERDGERVGEGRLRRDVATGRRRGARSSARSAAGCR